MAIKSKTKAPPRKPFVNEEPVGIKLLKMGAIIVAMLILLVIIAALMFIPAGVTTTSSNGFCATLISAEGEPSNPDPYSHQRQNCGALSSPTDCSKGGTPAWLEKNRPFTCEWQAFT